MPTAYVSFCKPVNFDTATTLVRCCREALSDHGNKWDKLTLMISSTGGSVAAAFGAYNEIMGMPIEVYTLNTGATDSSALMIFMAGKRRYACAKSAFLFHQMSWTFSAKEDVTLSVVSDAARWLQAYQDMMAETIADGTNGKLTKQKVQEMMQIGTTLTPTEAKSFGLVHDIVEAVISADARWWQV
jgi:ATP-dependent protease ClpP protease subunit